MYRVLDSVPGFRHARRAVSLSAEVCSIKEHVGRIIAWINGAFTTHSAKSNPYISLGTAWPLGETSKFFEKINRGYMGVACPEDKWPVLISRPFGLFEPVCPCI